MKKYKNIHKSILVVVLMVIMLAFSVFCAYAETEPYEEETYAIESFAEETTEYVEDTFLTEEQTTQDAYEETTSAQDVTDSLASEAVTETRPEPTYREPLPEAPPEDIIIPDVIGDVKEENEPALFWGFVAWVCIGVGIAVVFAILLTTKTKAYRAGGKKRYSTGDKISGKKRLLNDSYYHNTKRK